MSYIVNCRPISRIHPQKIYFAVVFFLSGILGYARMGHAGERAGMGSGWSTSSTHSNILSRYVQQKMTPTKKKKNDSNIHIMIYTQKQKHPFHDRYMNNQGENKYILVSFFFCEEGKKTAIPITICLCFYFIICLDSRSYAFKPKANASGKKGYGN